MLYLTRTIFRLWLPLAVLLLAVTAGVALLAPGEAGGYHCLVVPLGATQPEWTLDVRRGTTAWDRRVLETPFRYVQAVSPNGRYQIVRSQRVIGTTYENLGWFLEDIWNGTQTPLAHSVGFDAWSADSRLVAYVSEPTENPRRVTLFAPETGAAHTETLPFEEYIEALSTDGRYLLLQNSMTFERRVVASDSFRDVLRVGGSQDWLSGVWPYVGNRLVLLAQDVPTLFDLDRGTQVALDDLPDAITRNVLWSPDGKRFAVVSMLFDSGFGLNLYNSDGKPLAEPVVAPLVPVPLPQFGAWSADSERFAFVQDDALVTLNAATGARDVLVSGIQRMGMTWTFSPAAGAFLPLVHLEDSGLALTIVGTRALRVAGKLVENAARIDLPFWTGDASRVAVKWDTANGTTRLSWADSADFVRHDLNEPGQLYSDDEPLDTTARWLGRDALLYSAYRADESGIYLANIVSGDVQRVTGDIDWANPMISLASAPDGSRVVMSYRPQGLNGPSQYVLFTLDGMLVRELPIDSYVMPVWSPESARLAHWDTQHNAILVYGREGELLMRTSAEPPNGGFEWSTCGQRTGQ